MSVRVTKLFFEADKTDASEKLTLVIDGYDDYFEQLKAYRKRNKVKPPYHPWRLFKEYVRDNDIID